MDSTPIPSAREPASGVSLERCTVAEWSIGWSRRLVKSVMACLSELPSSMVVVQTKADRQQEV